MNSVIFVQKTEEDGWCWMLLSQCFIREQITTQISHDVVTELAATSIGPVNMIHPTLGCAVVEGS